MENFVLGNITFSPRVAMALEAIRDEAINAKMWEEECHKKDYECEELKERIKELEKKLCRKRQ